MKRLSHRQINPIFKNYEQLSHQLLQLYLTIECVKKEEPDFTLKEVTAAINKLKDGKASGPDSIPPEIFHNAGLNLLRGTTRIFNKIKHTVITPEEWYEMIIKTLFKNKGARKRLKYHRGIFLTRVLSKVLERLILQRIEPHTNNINQLQCESRKKRSTGDNIFIINGLIDHTLMTAIVFQKI